MRILLVHGLGRTPASLAMLYFTLRRAGHRPELFGYAAFAEPYDRIRRRLAARLGRWALDPAPVALLGHSLGGLLLRHALADVPSLAVHRLIMLGTPNRSPRRARAAIRWLPFRLFSRSCGDLLASPAAFEDIPIPSSPYTVIAGTGGPRWLARSFGDEPNDGIVAVGETLICDDDIPVLLPRGHTFLMNAPEVHRIISDLLASHGRVPIIDAVVVPGTKRADVQPGS